MNACKKEGRAARLFKETCGRATRQMDGGRQTGRQDGRKYGMKNRQAGKGLKEIKKDRIWGFGLCCGRHGGGPGSPVGPGW
jgi:hypothetical protein